VEYRKLGRTGIEVSRFGLGTLMLGAWGNTDRAACVRMAHQALEAGVNLVDTADVYAFGESERIVGEALVGRRDDVVVATKFHNPMGPGPNQRGNSRRWILRAVDDSLRRLRTDWIDVYQVHRPDPATDITETVAALNDLIRAGKIRAWGTSTFPAEEVVEAHCAAERLADLGPHTEQPPYSILCRGIETGVLPVCARYGMGAMAWSPLSGGWLTGKYRPSDPTPAGTRAATHPDHFDAGNPAKFAAVERLREIAAGAGVSLTHLSLAWASTHPAVTSVLLGPRTEEQLSDLLGADGVDLDDATLDAIDAAVPPGVDINPADTDSVAPGLRRSARRRPRVQEGG